MAYVLDKKFFSGKIKEDSDYSLCKKNLKGNFPFNSRLSHFRPMWHLYPHSMQPPVSITFKSVLFLVLFWRSSESWIREDDFLVIDQTFPNASNAAWWYICDLRSKLQVQTSMSGMAHHSGYTVVLGLPHPGSAHWRPSQECTVLGPPSALDSTGETCWFFMKIDAQELRALPLHCGGCEPTPAAEKSTSSGYMGGKTMQYSHK